MKAINGIKIFRMNDLDWWAGRDIKSVKEAYLKEMDLDEDEAFDDCCELTDEQADRLKIFYDPPDKDKIRTLREQLQIMVDGGRTFPCFFASTEW